MGKKQNVSISNVRSIGRKRIGRDFINNWIQVVYEVGGDTRTAYFVDGRMLGWSGIFSGNSRIFEAVQRLGQPALREAAAGDRAGTADKRPEVPESPALERQPATLPESPEASSYISEALRIIEAQVEIGPGSVHVSDAGSEGIVMEAARKLEAARTLHPDNALLHYAYASGLHLAMQYKSAEEVMKDCAQSHPDFAWAQVAIQGWAKWQSPFTLPPWGQETNTVHPAISQTVKTCILLSARDGLVPRAVLFLRDAGGDFQDLQALRTAKIDLATVISAVRDPRVVGIYGSIYDNPGSPYNIEALEAPFRPRGDAIRCRYEYLCIQDDIDFVVIDRQDRILLNKRLQLPNLMKETIRKLLDALTSSEGSDVATTQLLNAINRHQRQFSHSDIRY